MEQAGIHLDMVLDVLLGQDRLAGGDPAHERQPGLVREADAPGCPGQDLDVALARKGAKMGFGRIGRAEAEGLGNLRPRGGRTPGLQMPADEIQDFLLSGREYLHGTTAGCLYSNWKYIQSPALCKRGRMPSGMITLISKRDGLPCEVSHSPACRGTP